MTFEQPSKITHPLNLALFCYWDDSIILPHREISLSGEQVIVCSFQVFCGHSNHIYLHCWQVIISPLFPLCKWSPYGNIAVRDALFPFPRFIISTATMHLSWSHIHKLQGQALHVLYSPAERGQNSSWQPSPSLKRLGERVPYTHKPLS